MMSLLKHVKRILKQRLILLFIGCISTIPVFSQERIISGKITETGSDVGLPGVSIVIKGTVDGTITDLDGNYSISVNDGDILVFSFVGMLTEEIMVGSNNKIDLTMLPDLMGLEEVVVIGYGTKKKGNITGSIQTVDAEKLEQVPVASFDQALQGQASGVQVVSSSGRPGAGASIRIRGQNSVNLASDPLYIVDGVPMSAGDFSTFNTNDFASINVLKDASLTSIYGARAANGVIVATTKRGKNEKTKITYRGQVGQSIIARNNFQMMNTTQKLDYEEAIGLRIPGEYDRDSLETINTNWQEHMFRNGMMHSHELSAIGGNEKTRFYTSGGYYFQEGILPRSDFERYTFRLNLDHNANKWLTLGNTLSLGYEQNNITVADGGYGNNIYNPVFAAYMLNPYTQPYDANGAFTDEGLPWANPLEQLYLNDDHNNYLKINGGVFAEFKLGNDFKFKTELGGDLSDFTSYGFISPNAAWGLANGGTISEVFSRNYTVDFKNILSYNKTFRQVHNLSAMLGQQSTQFHSNGFNVTGKKIPNDKVRDLSVTVEADSWGGSTTENSLASYFAQGSYNYDYRYFLDLSVRRDGSSRFGSNNNWATFYSGGFMWDIKKEAFMAGLPEAITTLKFSATTGTLGNANFGNYMWRTLYSYGADYNNNNGSYHSSAGNPNLCWEKLSKSNIGVELGLGNRINARFDYYHNITSDMIFAIPRSRTSGFSSEWANAGKMKNSGYDLSLNWVAVKTSDFTWDLTGNVSINNNEVMELYEGIDQIEGGMTITKEGLPVGSFYMVRYAGVNPANGKPMWFTKDGEVTDVYSENDKVVIDGKQSIGPVNGGLSSLMTYKGISLSAFFSFVEGKYMINNTRYFTESNGQFASYNQTTKMLDYWKQPGDITEVPAPKYAQSYFDTRLLENASFVRLKNVTLAYTLPSNILEKTKVIESLRVYVQAQNLWTLSEYEGYDPEYDGSTELNAYPHSKTVSLGIDIGF